MWNTGAWEFLPVKFNFRVVTEKRENLHHAKISRYTVADFNLSKRPLLYGEHIL